MKRITAFLLLIAILFINSLVFAQTNDSGAKNTIYYESDGAWRTSRIEIQGWNKPEFNDNEWMLSRGQSEGLCGPQHKLNRIGVYPMWVDSPVEKETVYFRKTIHLDFDPSEAKMLTILDDDGEIYVNGSLVRTDASGSVDSEAFNDDILPYLHTGENVIAIKVVDSFGGCQSLAVMLEVVGYLETHVELSVPTIKQTDPQWTSVMYSGGAKNNLECGSTIGECGCVISSIAMLMKYYGVEKDPYGNATSPASLNKYFQENEQCSDNGCLSKGYAYGYVVWPAVNMYALEAHDRYQSQKIIWDGLSEYDSPTVNDDIKNSRPVILKASNREHWFIAKGENGQTFSINDPYFSIEKLSDSQYKNTASKMSRFKKTNSDFSMIYAVALYPQQLLITDFKGRKTGFDVVSNKVLKEIPQSDYYLDKQPNLSSSSAQKGIHIAVISLPESGRYTIVKTLSPSDELIGKDIVVYSYSRTGTTTFFPIKETLPVVFTYNKESDNAPLYQNVQIDIKPHDRFNRINCKKRREPVDVAVLSSKTFNSKDIDVVSIRFANEQFRPIQKPWWKTNYMFKDINKDKRKDLVLKFQASNIEILCASSSAVLEGKTKDGIFFKGEDSINRRY